MVVPTELARVALGAGIARSAHGCALAIVLAVVCGRTRAAPRAVAGRAAARGAGAVDLAILRGRIAADGRRLAICYAACRTRCTAGEAAGAYAGAGDDAGASPITGAAGHTRAGRADRHQRIGAGTGGRITGPRVVALIGKGTDDGIGPHTDPTLTRIGPGTGVAIVTGHAVSQRLTQTRRGITALALGT